MRPSASVDQIAAVTDKAEGHGGEDRLVRFERRQIADPCAADAEGEQGKRHHAARGCTEGGENAAERQPCRPIRAP